MQIIENLKVREKVYTEKLENGLMVMIIPKENTNKKYAILGTHFGSIDNEFIPLGEDTSINIPNGVAHFLEHKMFEQESGVNSLDTLSALGVDANAYTTNDHTAYLFECTDKFYEALDELMNYVQHPFFTDDNVEKEKGIIAQEITMYDDDPSFKVYLNALECMYKDNTVKLDIAGSVDSIQKIDKDVLYKCYNTFYNPSNMALVICGDFKPEEIINEIKQRLVSNNVTGEIKRIYLEDDDSVNKDRITQNMEVSNPLYFIGIKDRVQNEKEFVKRNIAIEVILNVLIGASSQLYKKLYKEGKIISGPDFDYEFSSQYAHVLISGQAVNPEDIYNELKLKIKEYIKDGLNEGDFNRVKKMIYGMYIKDYNDVESISKMFLSDYFKKINSFDYLEEYNSVTIEYANLVLKDIFKEDKMVLSVVKNEE